MSSDWQAYRDALRPLVRTGSYLLVTDHRSGGWRFYRAAGGISDYDSHISIESPDDDAEYIGCNLAPPLREHWSYDYEDHNGRTILVHELGFHHVAAVYQTRAEVDAVIEQLTDAERTYCEAVRDHQERFAVHAKLLSNVPA